MTLLQHYAHRIDPDTLYCVRCGQFLAHIQRDRRWSGKDVKPACVAPVTNIVAISHLTHEARP